MIQSGGDKAQCARRAKDAKDALERLESRKPRGWLSKLFGGRG